MMEVRMVGSHSDAALAHAGSVAPRIFFPLGTVKSGGRIEFRSQAARDLACLLDVDRSVSSWQCAPVVLSLCCGEYRPDFLVAFDDGRQMLVDACDRVLPTTLDAVELEALGLGYGYRLESGDSNQGHRLRNAKDLLRYASWNPALGDRIRLQAALSEEGSMTVSECMQLLSERDAVAVLASLALRGHIEIDLDEGPIGPDTKVRRIGG
jgi:hypothetical protein